MNRTSKSPYKTLFSTARANNKAQCDTTRQAYPNEHTHNLARTGKSEKDLYRKYHSSSRNNSKDLNLNFSKNKLMSNTH